MNAQPMTTPTPAPVVERTVREYQFSLGNSTHGPIGYCARIAATTAAGAVARLGELLFDELVEVRIEAETRGEYLTVYFNLAAVGVLDAVDPECAACGDELPEDVDTCATCAQG
jgi:hypothetical protein